MRNRTLFLVLAGLLVILACMVSFFLGATLNQADLHSEEVDLPNGDVIVCITSTAGGINCNWGTVNVDVD